MGADKTERERRLAELQSALLAFYDLMSEMHGFALEFKGAAETGEEKLAEWYDQLAGGLREHAPKMMHSIHCGNAAIQELIDECRDSPN